MIRKTATLRGSILNEEAGGDASGSGREAVSSPGSAARDKRSEQLLTKVRCSKRSSDEVASKRCCLPPPGASSPAQVWRALSPLRESGR